MAGVTNLLFELFFLVIYSILGTKRINELEMMVINSKAPRHWSETPVNKTNVKIYISE